MALARYTYCLGFLATGEAEYPARANGYEIDLQRGNLCGVHVFILW